MKDGEIYSRDSVVQAVREKLGSVTPISVYGTLRNGKKSQIIDNKYRLIT